MNVKIIPLGHRLSIVLAQINDHPWTAMRHELEKPTEITISKHRLGMIRPRYAIRTDALFLPLEKIEFT